MSKKEPCWPLSYLVRRLPEVEQAVSCQDDLAMKFTERPTKLNVQYAEQRRYQGQYDAKIPGEVRNEEYDRVPQKPYRRNNFQISPLVLHSSFGQDQRNAGPEVPAKPPADHGLVHVVSHRRYEGYGDFHGSHDNYEQRPAALEKADRERYEFHVESLIRVNNPHIILIPK